MGCLSNRRSEWVTRLTHELGVSSSAFFLTFTYSDDKVPWAFDLMTLDKSDFQKFMKRLRKALPKVKLKYYCVGEYGENTQRPHYHAIMFNLPFTLDGLLECSVFLTDIWKNGRVHVGTVTGESMNYTLKYIVNPIDVDVLCEPSFALISKGIGRSYVKAMQAWHQANLDRTYVPFPGNIKKKLPRYYRTNIYDATERQYQFEQHQRRVAEFESERSGETLSEFRNRQDSRNSFYEKLRRKSKGTPRNGSL